MDSNQIGKGGLRTILLLLVALVALLLARQSMAFSGSVWAWTAIVAGVAALAVGLTTLISILRKPKA